MVSNSKDASAFIPKKPTVEPNFGDEGKMDAFLASNTAPVARKLIALGYGPRGDKDPNYNPVFRHRYYLTLKELHINLDKLARNPKSTDDININYLLDDIKWFVKSRYNVQESDRT